MSIARVTLTYTGKQTMQYLKHCEKHPGQSLLPIPSCYIHHPSAKLQHKSPNLAIHMSRPNLRDIRHWLSLSMWSKKNCCAEMATDFNFEDPGWLTLPQVYLILTPVQTTPTFKLLPQLADENLLLVYEVTISCIL